MRPIQFLPAIFLTATILFALPVHGAGSTASIGIVDVHNLNTSTFQFNGASAQSFTPGSISVAQGGSVSWTNRGYENHTVTSYTITVPVTFEGLTVQIPLPDGKFDSLTTHGPIVSGETWTLDTKGIAPITGALSLGTHKYFCQFHPWMRASLTVDASGSTTASVNIDHHSGGPQFFSASASWGFNPRDTTVKQGTVITVTNNGHIPHTFTSYTLIIPVQVAYKTIMIPIPDGVFDSNAILPGQSYTLDTSHLAPGTYTFHCDFHPWMLGTLHVNG